MLSHDKPPLLLLKTNRRNFVSTQKLTIVFLHAPPSFCAVPVDLGIDKNQCPSLLNKFRLEQAFLIANSLRKILLNADYNKSTRGVKELHKFLTRQTTD